MVREAALATIGKANLLLLADSILHDGIVAGPCIWEPTDEFGGPPSCSWFASAQMIGSSTVYGVGVALGTSGEPLAPPPRPRTLGLRIEELAERDADFGLALRHFKAAGDDIRRLWIVYEYARHRWPKLMTMAWVDATALKSFCETANEREIRHRSQGRPLEYPETTGPAARILIREILLRWVQEERPD